MSSLFNVQRITQNFQDLQRSSSSSNGGSRSSWSMSHFPPLRQHDGSAPIPGLNFANRRPPITGQYRQNNEAYNREVSKSYNSEAMKRDQNRLAVILGEIHVMTDTYRSGKIDPSDISNYITELNKKKEEADGYIRKLPLTMCLRTKNFLTNIDKIKRVAKIEMNEGRCLRKEPSRDWQSDFVELKGDHMPRVVRMFLTFNGKEKAVRGFTKEQFDNNLTLSVISDLRNQDRRYRITLLDPIEKGFLQGCFGIVVSFQECQDAKPIYINLVVPANFEDSRIILNFKKKLEQVNESDLQDIKYGRNRKDNHMWYAAKISPKFTLAYFVETMIDFLTKVPSTSLGAQVDSVIDSALSYLLASCHTVSEKEIEDSDDSNKDHSQNIFKLLQQHYIAIPERDLATSARTITDDLAEERRNKFKITRDIKNQTEILTHNKFEKLAPKKAQKDKATEEEEKEEKVEEEAATPEVEEDKKAEGEVVEENVEEIDDGEERYDEEFDYENDESEYDDSVRQHGDGSEEDEEQVQMSMRDYADEQTREIISWADETDEIVNNSGSPRSLFMSSLVTKENTGGTIHGLNPENIKIPDVQNMKTPSMFNVLCCVADMARNIRKTDLYWPGSSDFYVTKHEFEQIVVTILKPLCPPPQQ